MIIIFIWAKTIKKNGVVDILGFKFFGDSCYHLVLSQWISTAQEYGLSTGSIMELTFGNFFIDTSWLAHKRRRREL